LQWLAAASARRAASAWRRHASGPGLSSFVASVACRAQLAPVAGAAFLWRICCMPAAARGAACPGSGSVAPAPCLVHVRLARAQGGSVAACITRSWTGHVRHACHRCRLALCAALLRLVRRAPRARADAGAGAVPVRRAVCARSAGHAASAMLHAASGQAKKRVLHPSPGKAARIFRKK